MEFADVTVLVLAGDVKCMRMISRTTTSFLTRTLQVVTGIGATNITVVAHPAIPTLVPEFARVRAGRSAFASVEAGIEAATTKYVLILSTDLPFLNEDSLGAFLELGLAALAENDACVPLAQRSACAAEPFRAFGGHRIYLAGTDWKCGSVFLLRRDAWSQIRNSVKTILGLRKHPLRLILYFLSNYRHVFSGMRYIFSHFSGWWSLNFHDVCHLMRHVLGVRCSLLTVGPPLVVDRD